MTKLYYLPDENRVITAAGLAAEIEYIGGEYPCYIETVIDDMIDAGCLEELSPDDPRCKDAEPEERTILIAQLFAEMSCQIGVMAEWGDDDAALLDELRQSDDEILEYYKYFYLEIA